MLERITGTDGTSLSVVHNKQAVDAINASIDRGNSNDENTGYSPQAELLMPNQPTANDTIDIGADVYEFGGVGANINVVIGADAAETRVNLVAAINSPGTGVESVFAEDDIPNTLVRIFEADQRGGTPIINVGSDIALAEAITDAADVWNQANLDTLGFPNALRTCAGSFLVTAENLANLFFIKVPFTPRFVIFQAFSTIGASKDTTARGGVASGQVFFDLDNGASPLIATDRVNFIVIGQE